MITQKVNIREIGWQLRIYYFPSTANQIGRILENLFSEGCRGRNYGRASNLLRSGAFNTGLTYTNKHDRKTIIVIGRVSDAGEFVNTLTHELNHFVEHVMDALGIEGGGEDEAYFTGELYELLFRNAVDDVTPFL